MQQVFTPQPQRDLIQQPTLKFTGNGGPYFGILLVNFLLCVITLGFYYPWAKTKNLSYLYSSTELNGSPFLWSGTGKEIFKGFIKVVAIVALLIIFMNILTKSGYQIAGLLIYMIGLFLLVPFAIHGANRYRWSRTSWKDIRFGYRGNRNEFVQLFFKELVLTIITLGFYGSWMVMKLRNYIVSNIRFGSAQFKYDGDGFEFFLMNLKGILLSMITLGIYSFWWQANLFKYFIDNLKLEHEGKSYNLRSTATGGEFAGLIILNALIVIFTLGIGFAWAQVNTFKFIADHIQIEGDIVLEDLQQTEEEYKDAMGEDLADLLDLSIA